MLYNILIYIELFASIIRKSGCFIKTYPSTIRKKKDDLDKYLLTFLSINILIIETKRE